MKFKLRIALGLFCCIMISGCALQDGLSNDSAHSNKSDAGGQDGRDTDAAPSGNSCGGELPLRYNGADAQPGEACGACGGGELECDGVNALYCAGQTGVNQLGSACANGGTWVCAPNNDVICKLGLVAPQNVKASTDNPSHVTVSWTPVNGAVAYQVEVGPNFWVDVGNVSQWNDTSALAGKITAGTISATLGTNFEHVALSARAAARGPGAGRTDHVQAVDAAGQIGPRSRGVSGARSVGALSYQWQRTSADSSAGTFADLALGCASELACTDPSAPSDGGARYYRLQATALGAQTVESAPARGAIARLHFAFVAPPPPVVSAGESFTVKVGLQNQFAVPMLIEDVGVNLALSSRAFASGSELVSATTGRDWSSDVCSSDLITGANYVLTASESLAGSAIAEASSSPFRVVAADAVAQSAIIRGTTRIPADGQTPSIVTITLRDTFGNNVAGVIPVFEASGSDNIIGGCTETDSRGESKCTLRSSTAGAKLLEISAPISQTGDTVEFVETVAQWQSMSLGLEHSCGIDSAGKLWCWGANGTGQLGNDSLVSQAWPTAIDASHTWSQVSLGLRSACAIRSDETLWCWGFNNLGQLGLGDTATRRSPVRVGSASNWAQVSIGARHACAIRSDSTLWCWGDNGWGQFGNGTTDSNAQPVRIGELSDWEQVSAGSFATCGVRAGGSLWCWGANGTGQLGDGSITQRLTPVPVSDVGDAQETWTRVMLSKSGNFGCGLRSDQSLWCWGDNRVGQLARSPSNTQSTVPVQVGLNQDWSDMSVGQSFVCATRTDHKLWCWGGNLRGELGDGTMINRFVPEEVASTGVVAWNAVMAGAEHVCALNSVGAAWCWGANITGQLGLRRAGTKHLPGQAASAPDFAQVSGGRYHACGVDSEHKLWCWGANTKGELGLGTTLGQPAALRVGTASDWRAVSAGVEHTCAIREPGTLWCWGKSADGALGLGDVSSALSPVQVGLVSDWLSVSASQKHTCGIREDHTLWCWGDAASFDAGSSTTASETREPVQIGADEDWATIAAGPTHQCGTRLDGSLWCWGSNASGQLGQGNQLPAPTPIQVGAGTQWASVQVRDRGSCGLQDDQSLWCWGVHSMGQAGVGSGEPENILLPMQVGQSADWDSLAIGENHGCGVRQGTLWCWGIGDAMGRTVRQQSPAQVDAAQDWTHVYAGQNHTHGVRASGSFWSAATESHGQLGDGDAWTPARAPLIW